MTRMKRLLCAALALIMILSLLPLSALALKAGDRLTGDEKRAYNALVPIIKQIASGQRTSTIVTLGEASSGYFVDADLSFTGTFSGFNIHALTEALSADYPYEMYWYGYFCSTSGRSYSNGRLALLTIKFSVADNYEGPSEYTTNVAQTTVANRAAAAAQAVVNANADKSDYHKLLAYRDYILDAVTYDDDAADYGVVGVDNDAWQMVHVFDGDPTTNVVCEGYAKAFKYLCDLSEFDDPTLACHLVSGWMQSPSGGGGHMWNIVTLGGNNYIVDVTNSESDTIGWRGELFLGGSSQPISSDFNVSYSDGTTGVVTRSGYRFLCGSGNVDFYYDEDTSANWPSTLLTLAAGDYDYCQLNGHNFVGGACTECGIVPVCGDNAFWDLKNGVLTISGTGAVYDYYETDAPWDVYADSVKTVVVKEGITHIGEFAFWYCENMTSVSLPASLVEIGWAAFRYSDQLAHIYYAGTQAQWAGIIDEGSNDPLSNAAIHYEWVGQTPVISKFENTANGIKITWNAIPGAAAYRVFAKTSKGWVAVGTTRGNSFLYSNVKSGLTYTFTVRCVNSTGTAFTSSFNGTGWRQTYVAQPAIKSFQNVANGIKINWDAVAGAGAYRIYAKTAKGWLNLGTTKGTGFIYTGAKSGLTYTFTIRALNAKGNAFVSSFNTTGWKQTYVAQPSVTKFENLANGIKITWGAVNGAAKYQVFALTSKGWVAVGTTANTSFVWKGAKSGLTYTFTVRCMNARETGYTSSFNGAGWKQTYVAQPAISGLTNTAKGIRIEWNAVAGAGKYRVYAKTSKGWMNLGTTDGTSFLWTGARSGYTYTFTLRALNAAGNAFVSSFNTTGWSIKRP